MLYEVGLLPSKDFKNFIFRSSIALTNHGDTTYYSASRNWYFSLSEILN